MTQPPPIITPLHGEPDAVGVTIEPAGGLMQPTMEPLLVVRLPAV